MDRRQESDAAMLRLSEAKFTLENNIFLINEKYLKQANFLKFLLHKLTAISNIIFDAIL